MVVLAVVAVRAQKVKTRGPEGWAACWSIQSECTWYSCLPRYRRIW